MRGTVRLRSGQAACSAPIRLVALKGVFSTDPRQPKSLLSGFAEFAEVADARSHAGMIEVIE